MTGPVDKVKGRAKEVAGALTKDQSLKKRDKIDRTSGKASDAIDKVIDKANNALKIMTRK